ncbi:hypothetical protein GWI33_001365, partial [Rhynchophorus ferrugineus]
NFPLEEKTTRKKPGGNPPANPTDTASHSHAAVEFTYHKFFKKHKNRATASIIARLIAARITQYFPAGINLWRADIYHLFEMDSAHNGGKNCKSEWQKLALN